MLISQQVQVGHADSPQPGLKGASYIFPGKIKSFQYESCEFHNEFKLDMQI